MKRHCSVFILFFYCSLLSAANNPDSLQHLLQSVHSDSLRLRLLNDLSYQLSDSDPAQSLLYAAEGLQLSETLADRQQKRQLLQQMGLVHYRLGNYDKTLDYFRQVLGMYEEDRDSTGISKMYNNLGILYQDFDNPTQALDYYRKSLDIKKALGDSSQLSSTYCNIGLLYLKMEQPKAARPYFNRALAIDQQFGNKEALVYTYENMGRMYTLENSYDSALYCFNRSLNLLDVGKGHYERATILNCIARIYLQEKQALQAISYLNEAIGYGLKVNTRIRLKESYKSLADAYSLLNNYKQAYLFHQKYMDLKDSIFSEENLKKISDIESNYQIRQREKEIELLKKDAEISSLHLSRSQVLSNFLYSGLFLFFMAILFLYRQYKSKNNSHKLLKEQHNVISTRNEHITSSIQYAKTIQEAILPQENRLLLHFPDSFLYCQPRDIVNGDFYWLHPQDDAVALLAVVDCTGHGVPGAFMTVMANSLLNQIVLDQKVQAPALILNELHSRLQNMLHSQKGFQISKDGLDLVICRIDRRQNTLTYASAKRPVYHIQEQALRVFNGNRTTLGGPLSVIKQQFQEYSFNYQPGSCLYLFSDGLTDQFGEQLNKKFMHARLKNMLLQLHQLPMQQQKHQIEQLLKNWQGKLEQTDDMLLLGVRL